ncbi:MAG: hypothetical protein K2O78_01580 [Muribaculaceae bacterium]|nr:hypothetical protein [Muribaculaceae bacterium]
MKKLLIIAIMAMGYFGISKAQEYKEGLIYDLTGNVKEMKLSTKNSFLKTHVKFQNNGKCKKSMTFFDDENYPLGYDLSTNVMNFSLSQKVDYDEQHRVSLVTLKSSQDGGTTQTTTHHYTDPNFPTQIGRSVFSQTDKNGEVLADCEYSGYVYDDNGNWTSRQVKQTVTQINKKGGSMVYNTQYTETRTIKYF